MFHINSKKHISELLRLVTYGLLYTIDYELPIKTPFIIYP
jgi:hypothetical protein